MLPVYAHDKEFKASKGFRLKEKVYGWLRLVFADPQTRNLFLFLLLNLSFAFVELTYGIWTNSLGLISDAFHMFFDCTALLAGVAASIITKWRPNDRFSYGYVRAEVLAGFVNGLFLLFIAFFIFSEAVERALEPPEVKHERLFLVSVLGLLVNMVGIFVFQHGGAHGHSHGGGGHGHSHGGESKGHSHDQGNALLNFGGAPANNHGHSHGGDDHSHSHNSHGHSHDEGGRSQIMQGVFLHILADTLGSVGVIISAVLMGQFGWMIADPICSMFIASLVGLSVIPLLRDSIHVLMQRTPKEIENSVAGCYQRVMQLEGVLSVQQPHFWTLCTDTFIGSLKVEVTSRADPKFIQTHVHSIFAQIGVKQLYVQIDYAHM